jgi:NADPH:quinone reductase-like Zn-dependent oxidoreductase
VVVKARGLAPLPGDVEFHGGREPADLQPDRVRKPVRARQSELGQSVLFHDAAGGVGSPVP